MPQGMRQDEKAWNTEGYVPARPELFKCIVNGTAGRAAAGHDKSVRIPAEAVDGDLLPKDRMTFARSADIAFPKEYAGLKLLRSKLGTVMPRSRSPRSRRLGMSESSRERTTSRRRGAAVRSRSRSGTNTVACM